MGQQAASRGADTLTAMFEGFEDRKDEGARKRWMASTGTSIVAFVLLAGVGALVARNTVVKMRAEEQIDVTFHATPEPEELKKEAPPPPPPAPTPRRGGPRPGKKLENVTKIPDVKPEEAMVASSGSMPQVDEEAFGDGEGDQRPAPPAPPPPPEVVELPDPVDVADDVEPARPLAGNLPPAYPEEMRKRGVEDTVILRVTISEDGAVVDVRLLRGNEPFASAAISVVRTWRFSPERVDGLAQKATKVVRVPFRIRA